VQRLKVKGEAMELDNFILETLPDDVIETTEERDAFIRNLPPADGGFEFVVADLQKWQPGRHVRVAFLGGDTSLHQDIEEATRQITEACNLTLDFGRNAATGEFRIWSEADLDYSAEIRVSFDQAGRFSLIGTDSIDPGVGLPAAAVGGRPGQRSLNLGGFDVRRPANWQGVVRHEFMHALAFHHAHQNLRGPCENAFRWEDDEGYQPTQTQSGMFVADVEGRRPGIYTYLSGAPNRWARTKVDRNLRKVDDDNVIVGPFDRASIMLYRFPEMFYQVLPSDCAPLGDGITLSDGDKRGLTLLYPQMGPEVAEIATRNEAMLEAINSLAEPLRGLETADTGMAQRVAAILRGR
jgi:hypothetical protein